MLAFALEELDDAQREVFVLYEIEGFVLQEIAKLGGMPLQTVYSKLTSARRIVQKHFSEAYAEPESAQ